MQYGDRELPRSHECPCHASSRSGRRDLFDSIERSALRALPAQDYEYAEWRLARVGLDYHVEVKDFFYSVPHTLIRAEVDIRVTARTVEIFHRGRRIAAHQRRYGGRRHGTDPDHMPSSHRRYAEWTPDRFRRWARTIGPNTEALVIAVLRYNKPVFCYFSFYFFDGEKLRVMTRTMHA